MAFPTTAARRDLIVGRDLTSGGTIITEPFYLETEQPIFWGDSHESIMPVAKRYATGSDGIATISLPNTSQAGWKDSAQQAITGWHYKITRTVAGQKTTVIFALPSGVGPVYLNDLVRENPTAPVTVAYQGVLTVNGVGPDGTGNVAVAGGGGGGGSSDLAGITDMSTLARAFNKNDLSTQAQMRAIIGAGTSDLGLGTGSTTARAGNNPFSWSETTSKPTTFAPIVGTGAADAMAGNTAIAGISGATAALAAKADASVVTALASTVAGKADASALSAYLLNSQKNANNGVAGLSSVGLLVYATAPPGSMFRVDCPGDVQPLRNTLSTRSDIFFRYYKLTEITIGGGYAIDGDTWLRKPA